jgi:4-hydroxybenzoate polyprenyltransferase
MTPDLQTACRQALNLLRGIRWREALVLQGTPLMGVIFSAGNISLRQVPALAEFCAASFLLVLHIWCLNDWADHAHDRATKFSRDGALAGRQLEAPVLLGLSVGFLLLCSGLLIRLPPSTRLVGAALVSLGFLYSFPGVYTKGAVWLSSVTHLVGGALHFLFGYSLFSVIDSRAMLIALFFAMVFTAGHATQEIQDHEADLCAGIRTKAAIVGKRRAFLGAVGLFAASYSYLAWLAWNSIVAARLGLVSMLLLPVHLRWSAEAWRDGLTCQSVARLRDRYRLLFAVIGLGIASLLFT